MATDKQSQDSSESPSQRTGAGTSDDLKSREYRDSQGNVHHHTRTYQQQHGQGGSTETSGGQARGSSSGRGAAAESGSEAVEAEDEVQIQVDMLAAMAQMDLEAAVAYERAAELVDSSEDAERLREFGGDHRRHIRDIGNAIERLGAEASAAAPPPESSVFAQLTTALGMMGSEAALLALLGNEQFTNAAYETALELVDDEQTRALLERNYEDERRHIDWLSEHTEPAGAEEATQDED